MGFQEAPSPSLSTLHLHNLENEGLLKISTLLPLLPTLVWAWGLTG